MTNDYAVVIEEIKTNEKIYLWMEKQECDRRRATKVDYKITNNDIIILIIVINLDSRLN